MAEPLILLPTSNRAHNSIYACTRHACVWLNCECVCVCEWMCGSMRTCACMHTCVYVGAHNSMLTHMFVCVCSV